MLIMSALLFAAAGARAQGTYYHVDASQTDDSGAGTNWATAKRTIQAAVDAASDGDPVLVTNGVYNAGGAVTPGFALTNRVCITNAITVRSMNGPEVTIIEGAEASGGEWEMTPSAACS